MARNYNSKRWRKKFQKLARRGGKGAYSELPRAAYDAFTVELLRTFTCNRPNPFLQCVEAFSEPYCRRRLDRSKKRLLRKSPGRSNYYTFSAEKAALQRTIQSLKEDETLVPTTTAPNMRKRLVRDIMTEELEKERPLYHSITRYKRKMLGRPESRKFFRGLEKRHKTQMRKALFWAAVNALGWELEHGELS
jgi:hypothetical protein